ncbi:hypothetical protein BB558_006242, partial [Smittium angustum]
EAKLVYGTVYSIRNIVNKLKGSDRSIQGNGEGFLSYKTKDYKSHYYESLTGIRMVLNTDINTHDTQSVLEHIYSHIFVEYLVKNPMTIINGRDVEFGASDSFKNALNTYIQSLPTFQA